MPTYQLYPDIEPYQCGSLPVSDLHNLYYEEAGNPNGKPIVFLHGGPGGCIRPKSRTYFDPQYYHIILFDQRGVGKSTPKMCLDENTTWHLIDDIEKLREYLNIDKWLVFGGSWGSTLALTYAIQFPQQVCGLILRGIFLGRKKEMDWLYQHGASMIHPKEWHDFLAPIPLDERGDILHAYYRRLITGTEAERISIAKTWNTWEDINANLLPQPKEVQDELSPDKTRHEADLDALAIALIETHYFVNHCFFGDENYILNRLDRLDSIPCMIVQGQYDTVCPPVTAWEVKQRYPRAELTIVPDGSHAGSVGSMAVELVRATEKFKYLPE
jgi:proline iminopeptidase